MSQRDLLWFLGGASIACAIGAVMLWIVFSSDRRAAQELQASLPAWHPTAQTNAVERGSDLHTVANQMRRERNYAAARDAYSAMEKQGVLTADEWADYADVVASLQNGSLAGEPSRLLGEALKANPAHPKALWLRASLAHQEARYEEALGWWKRLREQIPPDSPDQRIVEANIEQASRLIAGNDRAPHPDLRRTPDLDLRLGQTFR